MNDVSIDVGRIEAALKPLQQKSKLGSFIMKVGVFIFIALFVLTFVSGGSAIGFDLMKIGFPILIFCLIGGSIYYHFARSKYVKEFKNVLAVPVLRSMFGDARYYPERGFTSEEFQAARLIKWRGDFRYHSEDLIAGVHRGISFRQADVKITHTTGSGKNRHTVVDVNGRIWEFDCPRQVSSNVLIVKDNTHAALEYGMNKIEMEDVEFNRMFDVYSEDEHSAFYVLTPHFMEYIKSLHRQDKAVYISFDGDKLYFMQSGRGGIFEPSDAKVDVRSEIEKAKKELGVIDKIIDTLKVER